MGKGRQAKMSAFGSRHDKFRSSQGLPISQPLVYCSCNPRLLLKLLHRQSSCLVPENEPDTRENAAGAGLCSGRGAGGN
jgi:hypothetical protein